MKRRPTNRLAPACLLATAFALFSCESTPAPSATQPAPAEPVAATPSVDGEQPNPLEVRPGDTADTQPSGDAATTQRSATTTDTTQNPPEEEPPAYVRVLERFQPDRRAVVRSRVDGTHRLIIETDNVSRLRIDRRELPLDRNRSMTLRIDDQGIEWTPGRDVVVLERSRAGAWTPVAE